MLENWKDVVGYENYQISNLGNVRSLNYRGTGKEKILRPGLNSNGYCHVSLWKDKTKKVMNVHRLVALSFIPNPENKPCIDHINGDRSDNREENLRWCTNKENCNFPLARKNKSQSQINNPKKSKTVLQLDINTREVIKEFPSGKEACRQTGISFKSISACCNGKLKTSGNYFWRYK